MVSACHIFCLPDYPFVDEYVGIFDLDGILYRMVDFQWKQPDCARLAGDSGRFGGSIGGVATSPSQEALKVQAVANHVPLPILLNAAVSFGSQ